MGTIAIISISVAAIVVIGYIFTNNQIIVTINRVLQAFGSIGIYLKKRLDLLPNLVAILKKYMTPEKDVLLQITSLLSHVEQVKLPNPKKKLRPSIRLPNY